MFSLLLVGVIAGSISEAKKCARTLRAITEAGRNVRRPRLNFSRAGGPEAVPLGWGHLVVVASPPWGGFSPFLTGWDLGWVFPPQTVHRTLYRVCSAPSPSSPE